MSSREATRAHAGSASSRAPAARRARSAAASRCVPRRSAAAAAPAARSAPAPRTMSGREPPAVLARPRSVASITRPPCHWNRSGPRMTKARPVACATAASIDGFSVFGSNAASATTPAEHAQHEHDQQQANDEGQEAATAARHGRLHSADDAPVLARDDRPVTACITACITACRYRRRCGGRVGGAENPSVLKVACICAGNSASTASVPPSGCGNWMRRAWRCSVGGKPSISAALRPSFSTP